MQARRRRFPRRCHRTNGRFFKAAHTVQRRGVDRSKNSTCTIWRASADSCRPSRSNTDALSRVLQEHVARYPR
jgi:hypothetical protein